MSRTLVLAGLLIDSWRDQSRQTAPGEMNLPVGAVPVSRGRSTCKDVIPAPRLTSLDAPGANKCEPGCGEWFE